MIIQVTTGPLTQQDHVAHAFNQDRGIRYLVVDTAPILVVCGGKQKTSNPFAARDIPTLDESFVVIRFKGSKKIQPDFRYLINMIHDSFMSRRNTIVVPGGKMGFAMEIILQPLIEQRVRREC